MPAERLVDLHAHTTVSDGTLTPTELVRLAHARGLVALALTDHDHVGGISEARRAAEPLGIEIVPGIELSLSHEGRDVHLLGYFVDTQSAPFLARLDALRSERARRAQEIVERLAELGARIPLDEVAGEALREGASIGRPHVARALVRHGHAASIQDAFDRYLGDGRPAAVPKARLSLREGIAIVHDAGGLAVLAHPVLVPEPQREGLVRELARLGLDGIEVEYPKHDATLRASLATLAASLGLATTGGSDFHGANKPDVELGTGIGGNIRVPVATLDALRARRAK